MTAFPSSAWISALAYRRGFLAVFLRPKDGTGLCDTALLYGPDVPAWLPGILAAEVAKGRSPGREYNRRLRGRFSYQRIEGWREVQELERLMV